MYTEGLQIEYQRNELSKRHDQIVVLNDWTYTPELSEIEEFTVSKGFVADYASIPSVLTWIADPNDKRLREAALGHDFIWKNKGLFNYPELMKLSNREFQRKAISEGYPKWAARVMRFALDHHPRAKRIWNGGDMNY